ncbi:MAG: hypothetical protein ABJA81_10795 [Nocardioidaceae bacterium]
MEKGNAVEATSLGGLADTAKSGLMESTTTVTSVVSGVGGTAAESMTKAVADKATDAAVDEARERMRSARDGEKPPDAPSEQ